MSTTAGAPRTGRDNSTTPPRGDDYANDAKVLSFVKDRVQRDAKANLARKLRDRADLQALQFYRGGEDNHWTVWDPASQTYVPRPSNSTDDAALPDWFFRATSNLFATKIDGICSILNQSEPTQELSPTQDTDTDRGAAQIGKAVLPVLYEESGYPALRSHIHKLITLTNGVAVEVFYDTDPRWGEEPLPLLQCQNPDCRQLHMPHDVPDDGPDANVCPDCGQPTVGDAIFPPGHAQAGMPVTMPFAKGKLALRLLTSFEFSTPRSARVFDEREMPWIAGHGRMDPADVLALWPKAKTILDPDTAKSSQSGQQNIAYADQMRALSSPSPADKAIVGGTSVSPSGPVVWFVWADPVVDDVYNFPQGLKAVVLEDDTVLEAGPLPLTDDQGRPVKNVILRTFQATPGSAWGKPPGDDMVPLQKQLNLCQALAFLILMNEAAPTTWIPDTVTLLDELTGSPGSVVRFKSLRAGDKPVVVTGQGFPDSLKWFIEYLIGQFDVVSKLNAVLMGVRPQGDPTLGEVQTLVERGMAAFREPLGNLIEFEKRLSLLFLWTARQSMWSPRFYTIAGENGEWDVKQFLGLDLEGGVNIEVEPTSAWPKSQMLQNLRLDKAVQAGFVNPADPEVQAAYLTLNDLTDFKQSMDDDQQQVARQLDVWKTATDPSQIGQPDPLWNLPYHFFKKVMWLKTADAEKLAVTNPPLYQAMRNHVLAIQQLMLPPPAAAPPGPPTGQAVDHAVASGAIHPAHVGPPTGQVLTKAVESGALRPAATPPGSVH